PQTGKGISSPAAAGRRRPAAARAPLWKCRSARGLAGGLQAAQDRDYGDKRRRGLLRRHPVGLVLGLLLLILTSAASYLVWDHARHFQSPDDAFIAARQYTIAPKVSGYITAVAVTDNQHVATGDAIARIDDRNYRTALDQAQAQVVGA